MGKTKTISMPLEMAFLVQRLAERLQTSESAAVRASIREEAEKLGLIEGGIKVDKLELLQRLADWWRQVKNGRRSNHDNFDSHL